MAPPANDLRTPWTGASYGETLYGFAASKIADSGVAPIVAVARGYRTIASTEQLTAAKRLREKAGGRPNNQEKAIVALGDRGGDTLMLPWFAVDAVAHSGIIAKSSTTQYRRSEAERDQTGREMKYIFRASDPSVIDVHPATPQDWIGDAPNILVIEGLAKGDAALTSMLLEAGVTESELAIQDGDTRETLLLRLSGLMGRVPMAKRFLVASIAGVDSWKVNIQQWTELRPKGRTTYIAFDGDLRTNPRVWSAADRLFEYLRERSSMPVLLDLGSPDVELQINGIAGAAKRLESFVDGAGNRKRLGLDDYLTRVDSWSSVLRLSVDRLPEKPVMSEKVPTAGKYRIHPSGNFSEEYVVNRDSSSMSTGYWEQRALIGGRILSIESSRAPLPNERRDGAIMPDLSPGYFNTQVTIELTWEDADGNPDQVILPDLPGEVLVTSPADWVRKGAILPKKVLRHPEFPPQYGDKWLSALKDFRSEDTMDYSGWMTMGWVPTDSGNPAFIAGKVVLGSSESDEQSVIACVTDRVLPGAGMYGVVDTFRTLSTEEYKQQIIEDISALYHHHFASGAIASEDIASVVVAGMFRPTIPLDNSVVIYFYGPPGNGKSFFSSGIMAAWQGEPNSWHENRLPGQASDTPTSREIAMSQVPIWVSDDWAVSSDPNVARVQEAGMETAIRSTYNRSGKRRSSNAGSELAEQHVPIAQFVGTGENDLSVPSIRERCLMINVGGVEPAFGPDAAAVDDLRHFWVHSMVPARLCSAMIRFWANEEFTGLATWPERLEEAKRMYEDAAKIARDDILRRGVSPKKASRPIKKAAELGVVFGVLYDLGIWAGMSVDHPAMVKFDPSSPTSAARPIHYLSAANAYATNSATPGVAMLNAIHSMLLKGSAHITNPDNSGEPPIPASEPNSESINVSLGWFKNPSLDGAWSAKGKSIGFIHERDGEMMVMVEQNATFMLAKRETEGLVLPGAASSTTFQAMWNEGLCTTKYARKSSPWVQVRPKAPKSTKALEDRRSGVPVLLEPLLNPAAWAEERDEKAAEGAREVANADFGQTPEIRAHRIS